MEKQTAIIVNVEYSNYFEAWITSNIAEDS